MVSVVRAAWISLFFSAVIAFASKGQEGARACSTTACWDHASSEPIGFVRATPLADADSFVLTIRNTCAAVYSFATEPLREPDDIRTMLGASVPCITADYPVPITLLDDVSNYVVKVSGPTGPVQVIVPVAGRTAAEIAKQWQQCAGASDIGKCMDGFGRPTTLVGGQFVVSVSDRKVFDFSGGAVRSNLTDPIYEVQNNTVVRNTGAEDSESGFLGAFVHATPWRAPVGFAVGLTGQGDALEILTGISIRLGSIKRHNAYVVVGSHMGRTKTLPSGEVVGSPPVNAAAFANPPTKTDSDVFFAITFSFLGNARAAVEGQYQVLAPPAGN